MVEKKDDDKPRDVFISYVEEDGAIVKHLAEALEARGYSTWYYERDFIPVSYLELTREVIESCKAVILLISASSLESNQLDPEITAAHELKKPIIPLRLVVSHDYFKQRRPAWNHVVGATVSALIPIEGVLALVPKIVAALQRWVPSQAPLGTPPPAENPRAVNPPRPILVDPPRFPLRAPASDIKTLLGQEFIRVPKGPALQGLSDSQIERLIARLKRKNFPIHFDSFQTMLKSVPRGAVVLEEFFIAKTPVTNAQFSRFARETRYVTTAQRRGAQDTWRKYAEKDDHPVVYVSHLDAEAYCRWAGAGFRLPTADEWRKAYRGSEGRTYPWGEEFDEEFCNTAESQSGWETTPVGRFPRGASPYGCLDMLGNVEEWTRTPAEDQSTYLVLGGSWCMTCEIYGLPVLSRIVYPEASLNDLGFRCAI